MGAKSGQRWAFASGSWLAAIIATGCSGKVIMSDPPPSSAGAFSMAGTAHTSSGANTGDGVAASAGNGGVAANGASTGSSTPSRGGSGGAKSGWPLPAGGSTSIDDIGALLDPTNGWVDRNSNDVGIQGAVFAYADPQSALSLTSDFSRGAACIQGTAARVDLTCTPVAPASDCYGSTFGAAIGLNLNQSIDPVTMMGELPAPFDASALRGFSFELSGSNLPSARDLRFNVDTPDRTFCNIPFKKLTPGRNTVLFSEVVPECYLSPTPAGPTAESAKSALVKVSWQVVTNTQTEVPYDFCVSNILALRRQ